MRQGTFLAVVASALVGGCGQTDDIGALAEAYTQQCPTDTVEGLDVYAGTGSIDWAKVYGSGRRFAFIKATQGDYNHQSTFVDNWANARAAGVLRSAYHFYDGTKDGAAQAAWFLDELDLGGGLGDGDLAPMLDIECPTAASQSAASANCEYSGNSGWAPTAELTDGILTWLTAVEQATGRRPIIYSYPSWFASVGLTDARLADYPLFIASYNSCASVPAPWTTAQFWQYSASGSVDGVSGDADVDRFFGTQAGLDALTHPAAAPDLGGAPDGSDDLAPPPGASEPDLASADGGAPEGTADGDAPEGGAAGCGCQVGGGATPGARPALLLALGLGLALRRKRSLA